MLSFEWLGHITTGMVKYQRNTRIQKDKLSVAALAPHGIASGFDDRRQLCHEKNMEMMNAPTETSLKFTKDMP